MALLSPGVEVNIVDSSYYTSTSSATTIGLVGGATKGPLTVTKVSSRAEALKIFGNPTTNDFGVYSLLAALSHSNNVYYRRVVKESSLSTAGDPKKDHLLFESRSEDSLYNNVGIRIEIDPDKAPDPVGTIAVDTMTEKDQGGIVCNHKIREFVGDNYETQLVGDHFYVRGIVNHISEMNGLDSHDYMGTGYWMVLVLQDESDPTVKYQTLTGVQKQCILGQTGDGEHRTVLLLEVDPNNLDYYTLNIGGQDYNVIAKYATLRGQKEPPEFNNDQDKFFKVIVVFNEITEEFEDCTLANVEDKINDISNYVFVDVNEEDGVVLKDKAFHMSGGGRGASYASSPENDIINFATSSYDSTLNGATVVLTEADFYGNFDMYLVDPSGNQIEQLTSLSLDPANDRFIEKYINNNSSYITCSYYEESGKDITNTQYKLTGGEDGIDGLSADEVMAGLDDFSNIDLTDVDILCAPGWNDYDLIDHAIDICAGRQDCIFLVDPPFGLKAKQVVDWTNAAGDFSSASYTPINSSYAAVYWPWVEVYDSSNSTYVWLPPSGYVAAQMAYSDSVSRQWYAPAGLERGVMENLVDIEYSPTKEERDLLYGNRNVVNPIMNYRGRGLVIFGQKTTQRTPTALDRVNVRRLVNYIKRVITQESGQFLFDMNDEYCWQRWVLHIEPELRSIQNGRGLYDYQIVMDSTTVTEEDIANNRMPGIIRIKPTKTAEFIPITFEIVAGSLSFNDSPSS